MCSHRKRHKILERAFSRTEKSEVIKEDIVSILQCLSCGAIRIDSRNVFALAQGKWSMPEESKIKLF